MLINADFRAVCRQGACDVNHRNPVSPVYIGLSGYQDTSLSGLMGAHWCCSENRPHRICVTRLKNICLPARVMTMLYRTCRSYGLQLPRRCRRKARKNCLVLFAVEFKLHRASGSRRKRQRMQQIRGSALDYPPG